MDNRLLTVAKNRVMEELSDSLQRHPRYKDVQVYHKFHTMKERQQAGVVLRGASATRVKLAADDHMGEFTSICNVSNVSGFPGCSIEWAWEDQQHLTWYFEDKDVTSYLQHDMQTVQLPAGAVITAGYSNLTPAWNFAQVSAKVDGTSVTVGTVDGKNGTVVLNRPLPRPTTPHTNVVVTPYLLPDMKTIQLPTGTVITAGVYTASPATAPEQVTVLVNGLPVAVTSVDGANGIVVLTSVVPGSTAVRMTYYTPASPVVAESTLTMTYFVSDIDKAGYYLVDMLTDFTFQVAPMYLEEGEIVIASTTGSETAASLDAGVVDLAAPYYLYLKKYSYSDKFVLEPGTEYTLAANGAITFLVPLPAGSTLYASYRWQGTTRGPYTLPGENTYNNTAIKGVILAFAERGVAGDKQVVQLTKNRTKTASVSGGHYDMQFEILVYTRDPQSLSEMVDHIISDVWGNRRLDLISEGYTIKEMDPSGEAEESYDDAAGIMYFQHSISLTMMTEWKRFYPYVVTVKKINLLLHTYPEVKSTEYDNKGLPQAFNVVPFDKAFEVVYPVPGYPQL